MRMDREEFALSHAYASGLSFENLTADQIKRLQERARSLYAGFKRHPYLHNVVGVLVFAFLFGVDYLAMLQLPRLFLPAGESWSALRVIVAAAIAGTIHSYLMYSMAVFSVHEAFTHKVMFQPVGPISRMMQRVAGQMCRLASAEP